MAVDPYAPPQKVTDPEVVALLKEVVRALGGKDVVHTAAAPAPAAAPARVERFDDSRIVAALADVSRRLAKLDQSGVRSAPAATVRLDDRGVTRELRAVVAKLDRAAQEGSGTSLDPQLTKALTAIANRPPAGGGFGAKVFALRTPAGEDVNPATEDTLASLLADLQAKRDGTVAEPTYTSPSVSGKTGEGKFFIADSGILTTTVTNNWINLTFTNPTGSGKTAYIVAITVESDQAAIWGKFYRGPTTNTPTTTSTAYNGINLLSTGPYAATCQVKGDALPNEMDNATTLVSRVTSNVSVKVELMPLIVTAGTTVGFGANLGGAGNGSVAVYWFEEA